MAVGASSINIGQLRRSATLLSNNAITDSAGSDADNYVTVLTTRCSIERRSGGFALQQGMINIDRGYKMICRYQVAIVINSDSRWRIGNDTYRITDYNLVDDLSHFYQFILEKE